MLIPHRNRRHLMLDRDIVEAVANGLFHIHTAEHAGDGMELLSGSVFGEADEAGVYPPDSVLVKAQNTLLAYRRACQISGHHEPEHTKPEHSKSGHKRAR